MFVYWMRYFWEFCVEKKKNIVLLYPDYDWENYDIIHTSEENINIFVKTINMNFDLCCIDWQKRLILEIWEILEIINKK
jgi:hypothetical protein